MSTQIQDGTTARLNFEDEFDDRDEEVNEDGTITITMKPQCMICRVPSTQKCSNCKRVYCTSRLPVDEILAHTFSRLH
jgi:hypothetical protein